MLLKDFLRNATPEQRQRVADLAGTSVQNLYQVAGGHSPASLPKATAIEAATTTVASGTENLETVPRLTMTSEKMRQLVEQSAA